MSLWQASSAIEARLCRPRVGPVDRLIKGRTRRRCVVIIVKNLKVTRLKMPHDRDDKGRFLTGNNGGGRPRGARNRLAGELLEALADDFSQHGVCCGSESPGNRPDCIFEDRDRPYAERSHCRPLHVSSKNALEELTEARDFASAYRLARDMIGAEASMIDADPEPMDDADAHPD